MASDTTIATVLAILHEFYPTREIGPDTAAAWTMFFADWGDAELKTCSMRCARQPGRTFFPTPGEIAGCRQISVSPIVDTARILRQIEKLGGYVATTGYIAPQVHAVREALGDVIADAYATAGGYRCFSEDETTRSIAYREFHKAATEYAAMPNGHRPLIDGGRDRRRLPGKQQGPSSIASLVPGAVKLLAADGEP